MAFQAIKAETLLQSLTDKTFNGEIKQTKSGYVYLDLNDAIIHDSFPLLNIPDIKKPNYFSETKNHIGAHISVIYENEKPTNIPTPPTSIDDITITDFAKLPMPKKTYYALRINSPQLTQYREQCGLPEKLNFRGYRVGFHITVAVSD